MESVVDSNGVLMQLSHIKALVTQLEGYLGGSQAQDVCKSLASQISSLAEHSISLVNSCSLDGGVRKRSAADAAARSPLSDASDAPFKTTKKRKMTDKVKNQVRVSSAAGGDIPADDGHSWRKYGQKEILGAKNPRSYYRCTHRHSQGCAATKQVQRTDEDPTLFDVIYIGAHTCVQSGVAAAAAGHAATAAQAPDHNNPSAAHSLLQSLSSSLTMKTEGLAAAPEHLQVWGATTPFCLSSTPASGCLAPEHNSPFSVPSTSENWGVSPATSDSFPPFEVAGEVQFEFGEVMSAPVDIPEEFQDFDISSFFA